MVLWRGGSVKEQRPLPALLSGIKLPKSHPDVGQFSFSLYVSDAFQAAAPVLELRGSESKRVCVWALSEELPDTLKVCLPEP